MNRLALIVALLSACAATATDDDDDEQSEGQAVTIAPNSPEARGVLRVANELTFQQLDVDVALVATTARNIVQRRPLATFEALDAVPRVGNAAFTKLLAYARAHGFIDTSRVSSCPAPDLGARVCGDEHWIWEHPTPTGHDLLGATAFGPSDVWTVGRSGTVLHYDGASWKREPMPVCETLTAVWGSSATDLWAVGEAGRIVHRTAAGWSIIDSGTCDTLTDVWGSPQGEIWITSAGDDSAPRPLLRGSATEPFGPAPSPAIGHVRALHGFADDDIWAVSRERIHHWDGTAWSVMGTGVGWELRAIWGSDPDHLLVGGIHAAGGDAWNSRNATWTFGRATAATPTITLLEEEVMYPTTAVGGTGPTDMWTIAGGRVYRFDGTSWKKRVSPSNTRLIGGAMLSPTTGWMVGERGTHVRWDGAAFVDDSVKRPGVYHLFTLSPTASWLVTDEGVMHWDGTAFTRISTWRFDQVWASSATDVWALDQTIGLQHFDGVSWTSVTPPIPLGTESGSWSRIGGSGPNDVWITRASPISVKYLVHWNGTQWKVVAAGSSLDHKELYVAAPDSAWIPSGRDLARWDGVAWRRTTVPGMLAVDRVFGTGPRDIWAVGEQVHHFDGVSWTKVLEGLGTCDRCPVLARSPTDVWIVSARGPLHWDGATWTQHVGATPAWTSVVGGFGGEVVAYTGFGGALRLRD